MNFNFSQFSPEEIEILRAGGNAQNLKRRGFCGVYHRLGEESNLDSIVQASRVYATYHGLEFDEAFNVICSSLLRGQR